MVAVDRVLACTTTTASHLPYARALTESFLEHHPDGRMVALIADEDSVEAYESERFEAIAPADVGLHPRETARLRMLYGAGAYTCALKPYVLRHLVSHDGEALYLDGDCMVYGDLSDLTRLAREHGVLLTPHSLTPTSIWTAEPPELGFIHRGVFNAGVLAAGRRGVPFLEWWSARCARHAHGVGWDQIWLALVPALFEHHVLRDPGVNVNGWNLHDRDVEWNGARPEIGGAPLRCFHFCGHFDPAAPLDYRPDGDRPHVGTPIAQRPGAARVCEEYARRLVSAGHGATGRPYRFSILPGDAGRVTPTMRAVYRTALLAAERGDGPEPPNPFADHDAGPFLDWLAERPSGGGVSRYLLAVREGRPDVITTFPGVPGPDEERFLTWVGEAAARKEIAVPEGLLPAAG